VANSGSVISSLYSGQFLVGIACIVDNFRLCIVDNFLDGRRALVCFCVIIAVILSFVWVDSLQLESRAHVSMAYFVP